MKNLKIYKKALALVAASSLLLMSGCSASSEGSKSTDSCKHVVIYFENEKVAFKECDGYEIDYSDGNYSSDLRYTIKKDGKTVMDGIAINYNAFEVNHNEIDSVVDQEEINKTR